MRRRGCQDQCLDKMQWIEMMSLRSTISLLTAAWIACRAKRTHSHNRFAVLVLFHVLVIFAVREIPHCRGERLHRVNFSGPFKGLR